MEAGVPVLGMGSDDSTAWLLVLGAGFAGLILCPITDVLIVKCVPRLGALPALPIRITTAALTALVCAAFGLRLGTSFALPAFIFLGVLGIQLARIDIALHLLPNPLVLALLVGGLVLFLMPGLFDKQADNLLRAVLGAVILFLAYLILGLISPGGLGMGDVKLAAPIGLYLGYLGWSQLLFGGLLGFVLNGLTTVVILGRKSRNKATEVAHGPSMLGATAAATLFLL
ncbi:leader peptidase (prepilin peptidase)/N-methyltransferase [Arthrobacter sp. SLBN-100]|uniref:prepilin peptidase n=1 Tax=Arthrobacter sp. SLBN-100 TaxID=2768450 RepID=UPI0011702FAF|nr:prepilin peptidase [Arthrobacter sp. SLBN-100]TQJ67413.1 leader peptidase (prepilin peptidase)/N-methyltransferase [Arthrobacter sp. SLBN-100]